jgi:MFS family permease
VTEARFGVLTSQGGEVDTNADRPSLAAWYTLLVLVCVVVFGYFDKHLFTTVAEPLRISLHLSDGQLGLIQGVGFGFFGLVAVYPLGWLADRSDARLVLPICLCAWSISVAACGLARNFPELMLASIGIAAAEAGLTPIVFAVIPDLFAGRWRSVANMVFYCVGGIGAGLGVLGSGLLYSFVAAHGASVLTAGLVDQPWRGVLLLGAAPAPLFIVLILTTPRLHRSSGTRAVSVSSASSPRLIPYFLANWRSIAGVYLAPAVYTTASAGIATWASVGLVRGFHASPGSVGAHLGAALLTGAMTGLALAAVIVARWNAVLGSLLPLRAGRILIGLAAIPTAMLPFLTSLRAFYALTGVIFALAVASAALAPSLMQDIAPAGLRGRIMSLGFMVTALFVVAGPIAFGFLSNLWTHQPRALIYLMAILGVPCWIGGAVLLWIVEKPFKQTLARNAAAEAAV